MYKPRLKRDTAGWIVLLFKRVLSWERETGPSLEKVEYLNMSICVRAGIWEPAILVPQWLKAGQIETVWAVQRPQNNCLGMLYLVKMTRVQSQVIKAIWVTRVQLYCITNLQAKKVNLKRVNRRIGIFRLILQCIQTNQLESHSCSKVLHDNILINRKLKIWNGYTCKH